jgi:hypothetical protein
VAPGLRDSQPSKGALTSVSPNSNLDARERVPREACLLRRVSMSGDLGVDTQELTTGTGGGGTVQRLWTCQVLREPVCGEIMGPDDIGPGEHLSGPGLSLRETPARYTQRVVKHGLSFHGSSGF